MSHRLLQVNELIREQLNQLLLKEVDFPRDCLVTIVSVELSKDLRHAKVWTSVLPEKFTNKIINLLRRKAGHLQFLLKKKLSLKPLPALQFVADQTEARAAKIESLINQAVDQLDEK